MELMSEVFEIPELIPKAAHKLPDRYYLLSSQLALGYRDARTILQYSKPLNKIIICPFFWPVNFKHCLQYKISMPV